MSKEREREAWPFSFLGFSISSDLSTVNKFSAGKNERTKRLNENHQFTQYEYEYFIKYFFRKDNSIRDLRSLQQISEWYSRKNYFQRFCVFSKRFQ